MVSGGMSCVKYLLFCFNLLFVVSGIAILSIGVIAHLVYAQYSNFVYDNVQSVPVYLIVVGVVIFVVAFFGCCGAVKESACMMLTFSVLLLVIFALEVTVGAIGFTRRNEVEVMLNSKLNSTMYEYYKNEDVKNTWDILQHEAECCGMNDYKDWHKVTRNNTLPHTCCPNTPDDGSCTVFNDNKYQQSCLSTLKALFLKYGLYIGGAGIGVAIVQLLVVICACCLACSIRREFQTV